QAEAAVRGAEAALALAGAPYTKEDVQAASAVVAQAQAAVDLVQTQINDATVTAPVDGVIARKLLNEGDTTSLSTPIVTISSTTWEVAVQVAEDSIGRIRS